MLTRDRVWDDFGLGTLEDCASHHCAFNMRSLQDLDASKCTALLTGVLERDDLGLYTSITPESPLGTVRMSLLFTSAANMGPARPGKQLALWIPTER